MKSIGFFAVWVGLSCAPSTPWVDFGQVLVDAQGQTPELRVPWKANSRALRVEVDSPTRRCFQVDSLVDERSHAFIARAESGPVCVECEQRSSVARESAVFQFPSRGGAFAPIGALRLRLGLRDCDTLTRTTPSGPEVLLIKALALEQSAAEGRLQLRFIVTPSSAFYEKPAALFAVLDALNQELASAKLTATLTQVIQAPDNSQSDATFSRANPAELEVLLSPSRSQEGEIAVVLAGCLRQTDPVLHTTNEVTGYTPHIPGGRGNANGIFIQGALCDTPHAVPIAWAPTSLAKVLAHELGHTLGLYHSVEADGTTDQLEDTDAANLMFHRPSEATAEGFSPTQAELMRSHAVRFPQ